MGHIEHVLTTPGRNPGAQGLQEPFGVVAGEVGAGIDHLGLEPQSELHAEGPGLVRDRMQPFGPHLGVDGPIT